ncbi:hypothetical protein TrST_g8458 [Triparma strigata]|uniref:Uncharacterized protein n=1 Tax=Triparma strigata TaxID=1606541 RepID=A0A9W7BZ05_9STRA|nr:hypothetical protein TrST_g8458 [Triparma strigata]
MSGVSSQPLSPSSLLSLSHSLSEDESNGFRPETIPIHLEVEGEQQEQQQQQQQQHNNNNTSVADLLSLSDDQEEEDDDDDDTDFFSPVHLTALDALEMNSQNDDHPPVADDDENGLDGFRAESVGIVGEIVDDVVADVGREEEGTVKNEAQGGIKFQEYKFMYQYKYGPSKHEKERKERLMNERLKLKDLRKGEGLIRSEPYVIGKVLNTFYEDSSDVVKLEFKRGESLGEEIIKTEEWKQPLWRVKNILKVWRQRQMMKAWLKWVKFGYLVSAERERAKRVGERGEGEQVGGGGVGGGGETKTWDALEDSQMLKQGEAQHDLEIAMEVIVMLQQENHALSSQVKGLLLQTQGIKTAAMRVINGQQQQATMNTKQSRGKAGGAGGSGGGGGGGSKGRRKGKLY